MCLKPVLFSVLCDKHLQPCTYWFDPLDTNHQRATVVYLTCLFRQKNMMVSHRLESSSMPSSHTMVEGFCKLSTLSQKKKEVRFQTTGQKFPCLTITKVNLNSDTRHASTQPLHYSLSSFLHRKHNSVSLRCCSIPRIIILYVFITTVTKLWQELFSL